LIRFVVGPEAQIVPDILARLPGRGIWVSADRASLELARKKKAFGRSAKTQVKVPDNLADQVEGLMLGRVTSLLALSRKAGGAIAGYEKVKGALVTEWATVLIQASDGSPRGKSKLRAPEDGYFVGHLTATELGLAFGRDHVIHAALTAGGLTTRIVEEAARLAGLRDSKTTDVSVGKDLGNS
jgi:predicted RNA-binding protein YlxR (DUF448 family)